MGTILRYAEFSPACITQLPKPVFYCCPVPEMTDAAVSLNRDLALALQQYRPERRSLHIAPCLGTVLAGLPDGAVIKEFDVLFHPAYQIDPVKMLVDLYRRKPFSVLWPGSFQNSCLQYAEPGYADYRVFPVENYTITCVVKGESGI